MTEVLFYEFCKEVWSYDYNIVILLGVFIFGVSVMCSDNNNNIENEIQPDSVISEECARYIEEEFNITPPTTAPTESEVTLQDIMETDIEDLRSQIIDIEVLPGKHVYIDLNGTGMADITMGEYIATIGTIFSDEAVYDKYASMAPNGEIMLVYKDGSDIREIYKLQGTDIEPRFAIDNRRNMIILTFDSHVVSFDRSLFDN